MDLNHIAAFVRVVHDGSFTAAAASLGLPKSSVSRSVAQLEQDLGIRLMHRTTRKLHLTDAGTAYYERVSRALGDIAGATTEIGDMQSELKGTVKITAPVDFGVWALAPIVARFSRKHPGVTVDVALSGRVVDLVGEGFDLAVRAGQLRDTSLVARRLAPTTLGLYASHRYLAKHGTPQTTEELANHDFVMFGPMGTRTGFRLSHTDGTEAVAAVRARVIADDFAFVRKAVFAGAGIGIVPGFLCKREASVGKLVNVLPQWGVHGAPMNVVYPSARFVPQRVVVFREYLLAKVGKYL